MSDQIDAAISEAEARLADSKARHASLQQQMLDLNAQGVLCEQMILGIEGELKALRALKGASVPSS